MWKAILKFLVGFAIFSLLWSAFFLISRQFFPQYEDTIALIFVIGVLTTYFPWFFLTTGVTVKSEVQSVPGITVRTEIESINDFDIPVIVEKVSKNKYVLTWRYKDEKWYGILSKSGMKQSYKLILKLNDAKKCATLIDVTKSIRWGTSPTSFRVSGGYFRGLSAGYTKGATWGIRESFADAEIHSYKFIPNEIRNPVVNSLLRNGWDVRFALF